MLAPKALRPRFLPDGSAPLCFCHPPTMRTCRGCDALKACEGATASWSMEPVNHDGLRCSVGEGDWLIARASLHEPVVSLQMEADDAGGTAAICAAVLPYLRPFEEDIDLTELEAVAKSN